MVFQLVLLLVSDKRLFPQTKKIPFLFQFMFKVISLLHISLWLSFIRRYSSLCFLVLSFVSSPSHFYSYLTCLSFSLPFMLQLILFIFLFFPFLTPWLLSSHLLLFSLFVSLSKLYRKKNSLLIKRSVLKIADNLHIHVYICCSCISS